MIINFMNEVVSEEQLKIAKWLYPIVERFLPESSITTMDTYDDHRVYVNCMRDVGNAYVNPDLKKFSQLIRYIQQLLVKHNSKMVFYQQQDEAGYYAAFNIELPNSETIATFYDVRAGKHVFRCTDELAAKNIVKLCRDYDTEVAELYDSSIRYASIFIEKIYCPKGFDWEDEFGGHHHTSSWIKMLKILEDRDVLSIKSDDKTIFTADSLIP